MENTFQTAEIIEADMTQIQLELSLACGEFDFISPLTDEVISDNAYIGRLYAACKLRIVQPRKVSSAFTEKAELGLFQLFYPDAFLKGVLQWTNDALSDKGKSTITLSKLKAYLGLEMAMSLVVLNSIQEYWENKMFSGHPDFGKVMSRNDFTTIRAHFRPHPPYQHQVATDDPLHHCRAFMHQFSQASSEIATPDGHMAFDEGTCRFKGRSLAVCYIPSKPIKWGVRFYMLVCCISLYVASIIDNNRGNFLILLILLLFYLTSLFLGNKTNVHPLHRYCAQFRSLRTPSIKACVAKNIAQKSATASWIAQLIHPSLIAKSSQGRGFYSIHSSFYSELFHFALVYI